MTLMTESVAPHSTENQHTSRRPSMPKMGVLGASIHQAPLELLSALTLPEGVREQRLKELQEAAGFSELVYLATCNRVEFIFRTQEDRPIHVSRNQVLDFFFKRNHGVSFAPENFYAHRGIEAARHLFTVSSSLDSLVIGEAQILGQVKTAFGAALDAGRAGSGLAPIFRAAFRCARRVRRETEIGSNKLSMVSLASEVIREFVREVPGARMAIVGAGAMTAKLAEAAREAGANELVFVNRTVSKVEPLAGTHRVLSLDEFRLQPPTVDAVLSATSSPTPIFGKTEAGLLLRAGDPNRPFLFLDLALPRDVADDVSEIANARVWHMGTLRELAGENRRERFRAADRAREIVDEEVIRYHDEVVEAMLSPMFEMTQAQAREFAITGLDALFSGRLEHLSLDDKESLRYWVLNKLVPGVVHFPMKALAKSAGSHSRPSADPSTDTSTDTQAETHADGVEVQGVRFAPPKC